MGAESTQAAAAASAKASKPSRFLAAIAAAQLDHRIRKAQKREQQLTVDAGAALCASVDPAVTSVPTAQVLRKKSDEMEITASELRTAMDASMAKDREDWARATQLMRWVVVHRGLLDRWIIRDRMKYQRRETDRLRAELGALAVNGSNAALLGAVPQAVRDGVMSARADSASALAARTERLAPWKGEPLPSWLAVFVRETCSFCTHVWDQLSKRLFLRAPAVGALVAGWWLAHTFSGSFSERLRHSVGLGGRQYLSQHTLDLLRFWVPLFAAAFFAYLASLVAVHVQRKYSPPSTATEKS